jgi:hypothetical protein
MIKIKHFLEFRVSGHSDSRRGRRVYVSTNPRNVPPTSESTGSSRTDFRRRSSHSVFRNDFRNDSIALQRRIGKRGFSVRASVVRRRDQKRKWRTRTSAAVRSERASPSGPSLNFSMMLIKSKRMTVIEKKKRGRFPAKNVLIIVFNIRSFAEIKSFHTQ